MVRVNKEMLFKHVIACCMLAFIALAMGCGNTADNDASEAVGTSAEEMIEEVLNKAGNPEELVAEEGATIEFTYWEELKDVARRVKEENRLYYAGTGIWLNNLGYRYLPFVYMNGGALLDESQTKVTVDTSEFREAIQFYKDMRDENLFSESGFTGPQEANNLFVSEEVAFDFAGSWHCSFMEEKMPGNWGVTYMPQKNGRTGTDMGGNAIFCYKDVSFLVMVKALLQWIFFCRSWRNT